jgi:glucose/arabinose dehydrogenase
VVSHQPFIQGWMRNEEYWGRPNDIIVDQDGSLLISDDYAGVVYRISATE